MEIAVAFLAVFGFWTLLWGIRERLKFPYEVRRGVIVSVDPDAPDLMKTVEYVNYLRSEKKIGGERLIIPQESDIIDIDKTKETKETADGGRTRRP